MIDIIPHENNTPNRGPWLLTRHGGRFYPLDPRPSDFDIRDIAASLSKTCRYNGHSPQFYSVAEHCVHLSNHFLKRNEQFNAMWAWAHDASESIIGDMIRPIKWMFPNFLEIEHKIETVFYYDYLGMIGEYPEAVKHADTIICNDERFQLWNNIRCKETGDLITDIHSPKIKPHLGIEVKCWTWEEAERQYLLMYERLFNERYAARQA